MRYRSRRRRRSYGRRPVRRRGRAGGRRRSTRPLRIGYRM